MFLKVLRNSRYIFRCLIPKDVEGLLVAGRCISVDEIAFGSTRNVPACALTGEAVAVAASLAVKNGVLPRDVDVKEVQQELSKYNIPLGTSKDAVTTHKFV
ncbi:FAD-dependent oxidoreductase [Fictibacillus sp. FJAT-27399]|uniref:FAD-dependent oxidoreductase n=1 Tax=Fictibacillus sp. FJAT-27399 TaxID=1729689 RepID=UPI0009EA55F4